MFNVNTNGYVHQGTSWFKNPVVVSDLWTVETADTDRMRTYTFVIDDGLFYAIEYYGHDHAYENWYEVFELRDSAAFSIMRRDGKRAGVGLGRIKATTKKLLNTIVE